MGQKTRVEIVTEGMLLAGRDDISTRANVWLQLWLDSVANSWPWPMNIREKLAVTVAQGATSVTVGNGSGGVSEKILRVLDNCWLYTADYQLRRRIRLKQFTTEPEGLLDPSQVVGPPYEARLSQPSGFGSFKLGLYPTPDKAYLLSLDYLTLPAALAADSDVPWFPNDITMVQAICCKTMFYDDGNSAAYQASVQELSDMLRADRMRYGTAPGHNDTMELAADIFR